MFYRCFVIFPFTERFERLYRTIAAWEDPSGEIEVEFARADLQPLSASLDANIAQHISRCDFAIADISEHNSNVLFEVGYAAALEKPVILLSRSSRDIPSVLSDRHLLLYSEDELASLATRLTPFISAAVEQRMVSSKIDSFTLVGYSSLNSAGVPEAIRSARLSVDLLSPSLLPFRSAGLLEEIDFTLRSNRSGISVRILALDPDSAFVNSTARQLGQPVHYHRRELRSALEEALVLGKRHSRSISIRLFDDLPMQNVYIVDDKLFFSPTVPVRRSRGGMVFQLRRNNPGAEALIETFEVLWSGSVSALRQFE